MTINIALHESFADQIDKNKNLKLPKQPYSPCANSVSTVPVGCDKCARSTFRSQVCWSDSVLRNSAQVYAELHNMSEKTTCINLKIFVQAVTVFSRVCRSYFFFEDLLFKLRVFVYTAKTSTPPRVHDHLTMGAATFAVK